jgi:hypothetical protein
VSSPRLFALDQGFPEPIVKVFRDYLPEATLVSLRDIDPRLARIDDWQVLLWLHQDERSWDGLVTTDSGMLNLPRELATVMQTKQTLVIADAAGDDPLKATGLLFAHLPWICDRVDPEKGQVWKLQAHRKAADEPWELLRRLAEHRNTTAQLLYDAEKLSATELETRLLP